MKEFGLFIKAAREHKAITVRQAEELSGISNAYLSQIETGKIQKPSPEILHKLSLLYLIPYDMLMEKAGYPIPDFGFIPDDIINNCISLLIVDDSPADREMIRIHLDNGLNSNYRSYEAETGEEALTMLVAQVPDCVILDYHLPDLDGLAVFEKMKKNISLRDTSVIILTGHGNEETAVRALHMGAVNYLNKNTITQDKLIKAVINAVKRKKIRESFKLRSLEKRNDIQHLSDSINAITADIKSAFERLIKNYTDIQNDPDAALITGKLNELHIFTSPETAEEASPNPGQEGERNEQCTVCKSGNI